MAIQRTDVTLKESERLADTDDGGGRRTANEVVSGEVNNLMPDISRLDRTVGRINLRKAFLHIDTETRDVYFGSHTILDKPPADPNVSALLFSTGSHSDERLSAQRRIESYVVQGPQAPFRLTGDQLEGQRSITVYQRQVESKPEIGDVLVLSVEDPGLSIDGEKQFVRIVDLEEEIRLFTVNFSGGSFNQFEARVLTLRLSSELRIDFPARDPNPSFDPGSTRVRTTNVSQAASYFGTAEVTESVAQGDSQVQLDSVFAQIVPNTQSETAQTDIDAQPTKSQDFQSGSETVEVEAPAQTIDTAVTIQNRTSTWVFSAKPIPAPGTTTVEFRALGNWQQVSDRGDGKLTGDGSGSVDFQTGSIEVTLSALPDVNSTIIVSWAPPIHYVDRSDTTAQIETPIVEFAPEKPVEPGTLTVSWLDSNSNTVTASDDGEGNITGSGAGRVIYSGEDRIVRFTPDSFPESSTVYQLDFEQAEQVFESTQVSNVTSSGSLVFTLGTTPVKRGSLALTVPLTRLPNVGPDNRGRVEPNTLTRQITDDANGNVLMPDGTTIGTIDYSTGDITADPKKEYDRRIGEKEVIEIPTTVGVANTTTTVTNWTTVTETENLDSDALLKIEYQEDKASIDTVTQEVDAPPLTVDLLPLSQDTIVPGTVKFDALGDTFIDRNGDLFRSVDNNGSGLRAGEINYETGELTITDYPGTSSLSIRTLVSRKGDWTVATVFGRTPGSPLKPGSFFVQASDTAGNLVSGQANFNGKIDSEWIQGEVDTTMGTFRIAFGQNVDDSSLTTEEKNQSWYDSNNVKEDGTIWRPLEILPGTVTFNVVILQNLPLDADLLGLDPVRLPSDGRVPIFQQAGVTVLHNTQTDTMPDPLSAGETVALSRSPLSLVWLEDQNGERVDRAQYSVDLEAGEVTMADPLDLSSYTEPLIAHHRIEDMLLVSDVEIDGRVTVTGGANRDYPADGNTYLSSALIHGDLQSRPTNFFEQASWDGSTWKDSVEGDSPTASYDDVNFPPEVDNQSAVKERWAIHFQDSSTFDVIGETLGVVASGDINTDVAPNNPNTGQPYFVLRQDGFGTGWEAGNLIRFNTEAAAAPIWFIRTILSGDATEPNDSFRIQNRGDAD